MNKLICFFGILLTILSLVFLTTSLPDVFYEYMHNWQLKKPLAEMKLDSGGLVPFNLIFRCGEYLKFNRLPSAYILNVVEK
jgi:hypothetical protein